MTITYNAEEYLEKTIQSVIAQKYKNIEYIIIDGNSNDGTVDIIKKYEKYITYWCSEPDNGLYDAMNKGIDRATGQWINFMNAGDMFYDSETILSISDLLMQDYHIICGDIVRGKNYNEYGKTLGLSSAYDSVFVNHQASYTKMSVMKDFKFDSSLRISSDYGFFFRCYMAQYKFKFLDRALARSLEGGISQQNNILAWAEAIYLQSQYLPNKEDIFQSGFYKHLVSTPTHNQFLPKLLNNLYPQLDILLNEKKFILYGFGSIGELVYHKYKENIIYIVDHNYKILSQEHNIKILPTDILIGNNDYIFISSLGHENSIKEFLLNTCHIDKTKILEVNISRVQQCYS